jgi:hypothetical protein
VLRKHGVPRGVFESPSSTTTPLILSLNVELGDPAVIHQRPASFERIGKGKGKGFARSEQTNGIFY